MTPEQFLAIAITPAFRLLPVKMDSDPAKAMLLSIALQESRLVVRRQFNRGPARSYYMFERGGVKGVLAHPSTAAHANAVLEALSYRAPNETAARQAVLVHEAVTHNDTLACCLARLLLWTLPHPLPTSTDSSEAFAQYLEAWRPGAYARGTEIDRAEIRARFVDNFAGAWACVNAANALPETDAS